MISSLQNRHASYPRRNLPQHLQPFGANGVFKRCEAGGITARARQTFNEAGAHRIGKQYEHNGDDAARLAQDGYGRAAGSPR